LVPWREGRVLRKFDPEFSSEDDIAKAFERLGWEVVKLQENRSSWQNVREAALNIRFVIDHLYLG
jgi:hypothetical protein